MSDTPVAPVIVGISGASGNGWSELKDMECTHRYMYIKEKEEKHKQALIENPNLQRVPTQYDEAFQGGIFMHAARAHWLANGQQIDKATLDACNAFAALDCEKQQMPLTELSRVEYSLMFCNYANYWAIRPKLRPYAVELYLEYDWGKKEGALTKDWLRTTRYDDVCFYPDASGYCIGEFKTTYSLSGALKYYTEFNPQILLQWLIYKRADHGFPDIKGTMVDIWDKGKNKGTRHFVPFNERILPKFEMWVTHQLSMRRFIMNGSLMPERNYFVCNTFNDAYSSQCAWKERCQRDK